MISEIDFDPLAAVQEFEVRHPQWIKVDGRPSQETSFSPEFITQIVQGKQQRVSLDDLSLRDPNIFLAGEIHKHLECWDLILSDHHNKAHILSWLRKGVDVRDFATHFSGSFLGKNFDCDFPPPTVLKNLPNCKSFKNFISSTILQRIKSGAIKVWGKVGSLKPPYLVLPLTVEPSKPRLCLDARFLNLWMKDSPFVLDKRADLRTYVYPGSHMTKCDDKSGYDHVLLMESSQEFFGFEWLGWWFVSRTLPFGWKESAYIYQTLGAAVSNYVRNLGIPCLIYIDDRHVGEIITSSGHWSKPFLHRTTEFSFSAASAAIYVVCYILVALGYFLGIAKCTLLPTTRLEYLGFIVDSQLQAFLLPERKLKNFAELRESILGRGKRVSVKVLQKFQGKCISFSDAVPAAKLYIRNVCAAISSAHGNQSVKISAALREEISHWRFLDSWTGHIPWRQEFHSQLSLACDASTSGWGAVFHNHPSQLHSRGYWSDEEVSFNISTKEALALARSLQAAPGDIKDCRVDVQTDSKVLIDTWQREGSRSVELSDAIKEVFKVSSLRNVQLHLVHVPSKDNVADKPSRVLAKSDSMLAPKVWHLLQERFGGFRGHSIDLMALDENAQRDHANHPLPHFTPCPTPASTGVNFFAQTIGSPAKLWENPFIFPPFNLVGPVLRHLLPRCKVFTIVVPASSPKPVWWPLLQASSIDMLTLGVQGDRSILLSPSKNGFVSSPCPVDLCAFRINQCNS